MKALCASEGVTVPLSDATGPRWNVRPMTASAPVHRRVRGLPGGEPVQLQVRRLPRGTGPAHRRRRRRDWRSSRARATAPTATSSTPQANGEPALLTDYTFDNLGVPKNPETPGTPSRPSSIRRIRLGRPGLGGFLATRPDYSSYAAANLGKQKVPTLRNVDLRPGQGLVKPYGHNGWFKSLKSIVHFYNTRMTPTGPPRPDALPANSYTEAEALRAELPRPELRRCRRCRQRQHQGAGRPEADDAQEDAIVAS